MPLVPSGLQEEDVMFFMLPTLDPSYNDWTSGDDSGWWDCERLHDNSDQYCAHLDPDASDLHPGEITFAWVWE